MTSTRFSVLAMLTAALLVLAGCAPVMCAVSDIRPPHVTVDAQAWLRSHPGAEIRACYGGECASSAQRGILEIDVTSRAAVIRPQTLTVTLDTGKSTTTRTARFGLQKSTGASSGPCPVPTQWSRQVLVRFDGTLQVGGPDDGHIIIPSLPPSPLPTT